MVLKHDGEHFDHADRAAWEICFDPTRGLLRPSSDFSQGGGTALDSSQIATLSVKTLLEERERRIEEGDDKALHYREL